MPCHPAKEIKTRTLQSNLKDRAVTAPIGGSANASGAERFPRQEARAKGNSSAFGYPGMSLDE